LCADGKQQKRAKIGGAPADGDGVSGQRQASAVDEEEASANQQMVYSGK